jgi:AraC family transcriptional regulator
MASLQRSDLQDPGLKPFRRANSAVNSIGIALIADEEQWRVRPRGGSSPAGLRVVGTRWRVYEGQAPEAATVTPDDCHVIGIPLRSTNLRLAIGGRTVLNGAVMPGTPLVAGPGAPVDCFFRGPCDELHLHAPNELIAECARDMQGCAPEQLQRETAPARDPTIEHLGWALLRGDECGGPVGQLYVDCIGLAIIARLLGATRRTSGSEAGKATPLPPWRLKRAIDYVESRLDAAITLADLAAATGLTRMHFAAQFRAATGLRPHEYLLRRRVERAQQMLAGTGMPLADVALSVGFQTQSHFTTVFKRFTGQPPLAWRQSQPRARGGERPPKRRDGHFTIVCV